MEIISLGRGKGKTLRMIDELRDNPEAILVVPSYVEKERILKNFTVVGNVRKGYERRIFVMQKDIRTTLRGYTGDLYVDNLDLIVTQIFGRPVKEATINADEKEDTRLG